MEEVTADAFVNRDEPIPVIVFDSAEDISDEAAWSSADGRTTSSRKRDRLKMHASNVRDNVKKAQGKASEAGSGIQDRLLERCANGRDGRQKY